IYYFHKLYLCFNGFNLDFRVLGHLKVKTQLLQSSRGRIKKERDTFFNVSLCYEVVDAKGLHILKAKPLM
ncbi:MAG: hypothetical protein AAGC43_16210, partial [Bacteroidota bacterium]